MKARIYAALGEADQCRRHIHLAEAIHHDHDQPPEPGWVATLLHPGHLHAATGHAMATLAGHTGTDSDVQEAQRRLTQAVDAFDTATHARARTLAAVRLATLQLATGDPDQGIHTARAALQTAAQIRSARIMHSLTTLRTTAQSHPDQPTMQTLISEITTAIGTDETAGPHTPDPAEPS